jgi:putative colanic acid biosynthesis acetyltransferase WcaF
VARGDIEEFGEGRLAWPVRGVGFPFLSRVTCRMDSVEIYMDEMGPRVVGFGERVLRAAWECVSNSLYRFSPTPLHGWRCFLLRLFGARIGIGVHPYPSAKVWAPWKLQMADGSCLGRNVDCYCVADVYVGKGATVSQYSYLCTASHDYKGGSMALLAAPIRIGDFSWVCADVFIGPGVRIGEGAIVGARSTVVRDVDAWNVVAGSPVQRLGLRPRSPMVEGCGGG